MSAPDESVRRVDDDLIWGGRTAPLDAVEGFTERFDPWTGRAWLHVRGPGWRVPIEAGYGRTRAMLRDAFPDRPFDADWDDGRFPACPGGLPVDLATAGAAGVALVAACTAAWWMGAAAGAAVVVAASWPLARLRDAVVVRRAGFRAGPAWAPLVPWHELSAVCWRREGRRARVWARGARGGGSATIPVALLPALRARVRRLGALAVTEASPDLDDRYARWLDAASGAPWGLLLATIALAMAAHEPWPVLAGGFLVVAGASAVAAAIEARATGWGAGAVLWSTAVYATVLALVAMAGWMVPS